MEKRYLTQSRTKELLQIMYRDMHLRNFKPDAVMGIARGGLVPATYISHYFDVPLVIVSFSLRDKKVVDDEAPLNQIKDLLIENKKILMVDDICDTGDTLYILWQKLNLMCLPFEVVGDTANTVERNLHTAVLVHNEAEDNFWPDYIGEAINKIEDPSWIVFDWERY